MNILLKIITNTFFSLLLAVLFAVSFLRIFRSSHTEHRPDFLGDIKAWLVGEKQPELVRMTDK